MKKGLRLHLALWWQYVIAAFFLFLFGFPVIWMIYSSLKTSRQLVNNIWALPSEPTLAAYDAVLGNPHFKQYFLNSFLITISSVMVLTLMAAMAAYVFARIRFRGVNIIFYAFLAGMTIPVHVTLIPLYVLLRDIGWLNSLASLLFPYVGFGLPVSIYILREFFEQIPVEIEDAARIDGASTARIFWTIILPLSRPALVTVVILSVVGTWNEYIFALTLVSGNNQAYTLPLGVLTMIRSLGGWNYDKALSALTLAALPVLGLFFLLQRQIIKSFLAGAIKG